MKLLSYALILMFYSCSALAQSRLVKDLTYEYESSDDVVTFDIGGNFFRMMSIFDDDRKDDSDFTDATKGIDKVKILKIPIGGNGMSFKEVSSIKRKLSSESFEELMTIRTDDGSRIYVMAKERKGIISDLVIYGSGDREVFFLELLGEMDTKKISRVCRDIKVNEI